MVGENKVSKDVGLWGKFSDAMEVLNKLIKDKNKPFADYAKKTKCVMQTSQKVYFPADRRILDGKKIDDELAKLVKLPSPVTSILTEITLPVDEEVRKIYKGNLTEFNSYMLLVAVDVEEIKKAFADEPVLVDVDMAFALMFEMPEEISFIKGSLNWALSPIIYCIKYDSSRGYILDGIYATNIFGKNGPGKEFGVTGFSTILNTCALFNLENTKTETHKAPTALNNARIRRGKQPYYDYKVLVVDNERWDGLSGKSSHSERGGVRSHFRRGHIRRLETGKSVWVRHTIVQGSKEGFVEKTYSLDSKNALHQVSPSE